MTPIDDLDRKRSLLSLLVHLDIKTAMGPHAICILDRLDAMYKAMSGG